MESLGIYTSTIRFIVSCFTAFHRWWSETARTVSPRYAGTLFCLFGVFLVPQPGTIYTPLCLASFTQHNDLECMYAVACVTFYYYYYRIFYSMDSPYFVYPFTYWWHLGSFQFWGIMNKAGMDIRIQDLVWTYGFISVG